MREHAEKLIGGLEYPCMQLKLDNGCASGKTPKSNKLAKLGDAKAISKSVTMNDSLTCHLW